MRIRAIGPEDDRLAVSRVYEESWRYARARRFYERQGFRLRDGTVIEIGGAALGRGPVLPQDCVRRDSCC